MLQDHLINILGFIVFKGCDERVVTCVRFAGVEDLFIYKYARPSPSSSYSSSTSSSFSFRERSKTRLTFFLGGRLTC